MTIQPLEKGGCDGRQWMFSRISRRAAVAYGMSRLDYWLNIRKQSRRSTAKDPSSDHAARKIGCLEFTVTTRV